LKKRLRDKIVPIQKIVKLTPPKLSDPHIKQKIVCIRAHRERIFNVSTQIIGSKLMCHNYGQGGAGWTFLFGCVNESMRLFDAHKTSTDSSIAIIGAGCYGLLTAIMLTLKGRSVKIYAADTIDIPSNKSAGFFFPRHRKSSNDQEKEIFRSRGMESYATYLAIINGTHPFIKKGPLLLPGYFGLDIDPGFAPYIAQGLVQAPEQVMIDFGNGKIYQAMEYNTVFINSAMIMQELHRNIQELNIPIIIKQVDAFDDVQENIIFNCAGLGAQKLTGDTRMVPVQGHLITLKDQPPMEQLQYMINVKVVSTDPQGRPRDELIYYAPRDEGILGITFIRGQDNPDTNHHEFVRLLERCKEYFGS
jgi:hypothetical protein